MAPRVTRPSTALQPAKNPTFTLEDCYRLALRWSETIAIKKEAIEETQAQFYKAAGDAIGNVNFVMTHFSQQRERSVPGGSFFGEDSVGSTSTRPVRRERKFVIEQPLFQGFKTLAALGAAGSLTREKKEERIRAEQLLFQEVSGVFYDAQFRKSRIEDYFKILKVYEDRLKELERREKLGRSRLSEVAAVKTQRNIKKAELEVVKGELANTLYQMEFLTGIPIPAEDLLDDTDILGPDGGYEIYLERVGMRPDVKAKYQSMRSYRQAIIEAQSGLWPHLFLDYQHYEKREGFQSNTDWDMLFTVDVPIFKGGETFGLIKESVSRWKQAKFLYSQTKREAELEIKQSYSTWEASYLSYKAYDEAFTSSRENYRLQEADYNRSLVNNLDVLTALESLFDSKRDKTAAYYLMKQNYWKLQIAAAQCCGEGSEI